MKKGGEGEARGGPRNRQEQMQDERDTQTQKAPHKANTYLRVLAMVVIFAMSASCTGLRESSLAVLRVPTRWKTLFVVVLLPGAAVEGERIGKGGKCGCYEHASSHSMELEHIPGETFPPAAAAAPVSSASSGTVLPFFVSMPGEHATVTNGPLSSLASFLSTSLIHTPPPPEEPLTEGLQGVVGELSLHANELLARHGCGAVSLAARCVSVKKTDDSKKLSCVLRQRDEQNEIKMGGKVQVHERRIPCDLFFLKLQRSPITGICPNTSPSDLALQ